MTGRARDKRFQRPSPGYMAWLAVVVTVYLFVFYFLPLVVAFFDAGWLEPARGCAGWADLPGA